MEDEVIEFFQDLEEPKIKKIVFDTESDGFALEATKMWIICTEDLETGEEREWLEGDLGWIDYLSDATHLSGHNIVEHDFMLMKKLFDWEPPEGCKIQDTLIMSRVLDYKRHGERGHAMEVWGEELGHPKQVHEDWSHFSEDMRSRCRSDVKLNILMYKQLIKEYKKKAISNPFLGDYLACETAASWWVGESHMTGWPFDYEAALELGIRLEDAMTEAEEKLIPLLGKKVVAVDKSKGVVPAKEPRWIKAGCYDAHTANWFDINPWEGYEDDNWPIWGPYSRVKIVDLKLSSTDDVKIFLNRLGWVPLEWNTKWNPVTNKKERTSPKITEDSLEFLGGDGKLYKSYAVAKSRLSILKGWLEIVTEDSRVHGACVTIGTASMRARHQIIVNVPAMESKWGPEMRALFITKPGWKLIGCDSSGNQGRGLAYYLKDKEYTNVILNEDIHLYNVEKLENVLKELDHDWRYHELKNGAIKDKHVERLKKFFHGRNDVTFEDYINGKLDKTVPRFGPRKIIKKMRAKAKRIYYAFLFGAGGNKLWGYVFGTPDDIMGTKLKNGFIKAVPGLSTLTDSLKKSFSSAKLKHGSKKGFIVSLAGNRIYVDSYHKLLVYLLQALEKITCSAAILLLRQYLKEENIPYEPHIFMHDEVDFSVPEKYAERAAELGAKAFREGPKIFGIDIMDGSGKIGNNWAEVH